MRFRSKGTNTSPHTTGNEVSFSNGDDRLPAEKVSTSTPLSSSEDNDKMTKGIHLTQHYARKTYIIAIATICITGFFLIRSEAVSNLNFHTADLETLNTHPIMARKEIGLDSVHSDSWKWFNGDLNKYYNQLIASDSKRNPHDIKTYAVHRWLGKDRSTLTHYKLILDTVLAHTNGQNLNVLDAGCGLGAGLMWFETNGPKSMKLTGHTISTEQLKFINNLPEHKFDAVLKSYDDLGDYKDGFDVIYSIEAFVHSPNERKTLKKWSKSLKENGIIVIIDDFLNVGVNKTDADIELFSKSWMANVLQSTESLNDIAERFGLNLILDRDLGSEFQVNKRNYRNKLPVIVPTEAKNHQGWLGSMMRQQLMIKGKITYRLIVFQK